jgi:hypothetical protein
MSTPRSIARPNRTVNEVTCPGKASYAPGECLAFTPKHFLTLVERERQEFEQLMDMIHERPSDHNRFVVDALIRFTIYLRTWELRN